MKTDFPSLNDIYFDISNIFAVAQKQNGKTSFEMQRPRPTDALLLFANTTGICYQKGSAPFYIPHGALVYMPEGSNYVWENSPIPGNDFQENLLFEFTLGYADTVRGEKKEVSHKPISRERISLGNKVYIVSVGHTALYEKLFRNLIAAFNAPSFSPLALYGTAYEIFGAVARYARLELDNPINSNIIKPGLKYLTDNFATEKSIKEIADMCNISIGYFEKLFRQYAGISPVEYRNLHKINNVKMYLQDPELTLDEICEKIGYCDSGYLCRIFKKKTGMTPKEYRRMYILQTKDR